MRTHGRSAVRSNGLIAGQDSAELWCLYLKFAILEKKTIEEARDGLKEGDVFYYADEFNVSWFPTLRAM
jgi:hypothetical protein